MIALPHFYLTCRACYFQPLQGINELLPVKGTRLPVGFGNKVSRDIAMKRGEAGRRPIGRLKGLYKGLLNSISQIPQLKIS